MVKGLFGLMLCDASVATGKKELREMPVFYQKKEGFERTAFNNVNNDD